MLISINRTVRVKLTDYGREIHHRQWQCQALMPHLSYTPPNEDEDGWSEWQLWDLMSTFGPYVGLGEHLPFEVAIEIPDPATSGGDFDG